MSIHKKDKWWKDRESNLQDLGKKYACITVENKRYSQSEILKKLKAGPDIWNKFSKQLPSLRWYYGRPYSKWIPGFFFLIKDADLKDTDLSGYDLSGMAWESVDFRRCDMTGIITSAIPIRPAPTFKNCDFYRSKFTGTYLADFFDCDFEKAELNGAKFRHHNFTGNNLKSALVAAEFESCNMTDTDFSQSVLYSRFIDTNLGVAKGLNASRELAKIGLDYGTLVKSQPMPKSFFKRAGISESVLHAVGKMQGKRRKLRLGKVFVSYSDVDRIFAEKLHGDLIDLGIDCFFAPHDMPIGAKSRDVLEMKLQEANNVILVLSKASINSAWVEYEIETIYERERTTNSTILLPIRIDGDVMKTRRAWAANLRRTRNIGDFTRWRYTEYGHSLKRLIDSANRIKLKI